MILYLSFMYQYLVSLFTIAFSLVFIDKIKAQDEQSMPGFGVETNFLAAKVFKHDAKFNVPIPPLTTAADVNFVWQTYGKKDWQQGRKFPMIGIGLTYTNYGYNSIYGRCLSVYPNLQVPLIRGQRMEWTLRFGDGLGYVTRKYQTTAPVDTLNTAIGSHLNDYAMFMTDVRYHIDEHWDVQWGANFTHISNGDYHQPNLGVNTVGIHIGLRYFPATSRPKSITRELPKLKNRWLFEVRTGISFKEARAKDSLILPSYIITAYASRRWLGKNKFFFGADYAYHGDVYAFLKNYGVDLGHEKANSWDGAFLAGNEFLLGRVGIVTQLGVYYKQTFLKFDACYEKIGCNFYIIKKEHGAIKELFLSAMLLTHEIVAEYSEFGIGVGL